MNSEQRRIAAKVEQLMALVDALETRLAAARATVAVLFLELNGLAFTGSEADATVRTLALAAGEMTEAAFAEWLKANSRKA